jgi:hypothetical protein
LRNTIWPFAPRRKPVQAVLQNRNSKPTGAPAVLFAMLLPPQAVLNRRSVVPPATLFAGPSKSSNAKPTPPSSAMPSETRSSEKSGPNSMPLMPFGVSSGGLNGASIQR